MTNSSGSALLESAEDWYALGLTPPRSAIVGALAQASWGGATKGSENEEVCGGAVADADMGGVETLIAAVAPISFNGGTQRAPRFEALTKWEGRVVELKDDYFSAVVVETPGERAEELVEFDFGDVSDDDLHLVQPGAIFYWSVGYRTDPSGVRTRSSLVMFRRLPLWSASDIERAQAAAREIGEAFGWD